MHFRTSIPTLVGLAAILAPGLAHADVPNCEPPTVAVVAPSDGDTFEGDPAEIAVKVDVGWGDALSSVEVVVDGTTRASRDISAAGQYDLSVELGPGSHTLHATANDDCAGSRSSDAISIEVTAPAEAPGDESGAASDGAGDSGADAGEKGDGSGDAGGDGKKNEAKDKDGGCSVSRTPDRTILGLSALLLAGFGAWRLRRAGA
jgi:hypothetical protein